MGFVGILLAALIIGFLVMTQVSPLSEEDNPAESVDERVDVFRGDGPAPAKGLDSLEQRVEGLLQSSEDKYRDLDR